MSLYQRWIALPKFVVDQKRKKVLPAWVVDEMKRVWKGNPLQTLLIQQGGFV